MTGKIMKILGGTGSLFGLLASVLMLLLLTGCGATGDVYGTLDRDRDLQKMFLGYEVLEDYNYYTTGGYDRPNAILLIHRDYKLENPGNLWVPIPNVDRHQVRKWVSVISSEQDATRSGDYFASYILDPDGRRVGVWYSIEVFATVKFPGDNRILVYTPELRQESILSRNERFRIGF